MKLKKFAAVALSVALAAASMPISGLAALGDAWYADYVSMTIEKPETELLLGGTMELKAVYTSSNASAISPESASNAVESASNAQVKWEVTEGNIGVDDNGVVHADKYDLNNADANKATITASLVDKSSVQSTVNVEIAAPVLEVEKSVEVASGQDATITAVLSKVANGLNAEYDFKASNDKIAVSKNGNKATITVTNNANNNDTASVDVTVSYAGTVIAKGTVAVTVKDTVPAKKTLDWSKAAKLPVKLYINSETVGDDQYSIPFESNFSDGFKVRVADEKVATAQINMEKDPETGVHYVEVKAVAVGTTELTLSHDGVADITAKVVVFDSSKPAEILVSSTVLPVDVEKDVEYLVESEWFAELPEEDKERAVETFREILTNLNENKAMQSDVAVPTFPENLDAILIEKGLLKAGETAVVSIAQLLSDYSYVKDPTSGSYEFYMSKLVFDVEPSIAIYDANGDYVDGKLIGEVFEDGNHEVQFILPIPDDSANRFRFAKVTHRDDANRWPSMEGEEGGKYVSVTTKQFSDFTIEFTDTKDNNSSSSNNGSGWVKPAGSGAGSGSGSNTNSNMNAKGGKSGQWQQNEKGWWFRYTDGTYPSNEWVELEWQNAKNWYFFDAEGYLVTGWKQDGATWYYLHPIADGTQGHMYTGWNQIDGKWYYFSTVAGGPLGAMLSNTTTPDGYQVGADGAWIQ